MDHDLLTLTHPLVLEATHPEAEALLRNGCPHRVVPALVCSRVVALFMPCPGSTLTVVLAADVASALKPLELPLRSTFTDAGGTDVAHAVLGCDTAEMCRSVLSATHTLRRVQLRGTVTDASFLGLCAQVSSSDDDQPAVSNTTQFPLDLDLSQLDRMPSIRSPRMSRDGSGPRRPEVLRLPRGQETTPGPLVEEGKPSPFFNFAFQRLVFHPDTLYTAIGDSVFCFCHITLLDLRGLREVECFGNHVFQGCCSLRAVCMRGLPKLAGIGDCLFVDCSSLDLVDCRGCPALGETDKTFEGSSPAFCLLAEHSSNAKALKRSVSMPTRGETLVLTRAELAKARAADAPDFKRCPICEVHSTVDIDATDVKDPKKRGCCVQ